MLHAKKGPWFSCKKQGEIILKGKNPHKQKENRVIKITNAQLTTVLYLHC